MLPRGSISRTILLLSLALALPAAGPLAGGVSPILGSWKGAIELPNQAGKLEVSLHFVEEGGALKGVVDIPAQGAKALPLEGIGVEGSKVRCSIAGIPGAPTFDGALESEEIRGTFTQGGLSMPFRLARGATEPLPKRPQEPRPPFPYTAEEATYTNGDIRLAGTLTMPAGPGPFPAVILATGSGPQDRDQTILGHKPFWILADHLSRNGIAVLRVDDRGVGGSSGNTVLSTSADFAEDTLAGVRYLKSRPRIAADRIGIVGHSEGALVAPLAASRSQDVAFIVMLAGPGVPGREVLLHQVGLLARAAGTPEERIRAQVDLLGRQTAVIVAEKDPAALRTKLRQLAEEGAAQLSEAELEAAGGLEAAIQNQMAFLTTPWTLHFLTYDPRPALRKVKVPVLALNGSLDLQVDPAQNLPEIEKALKEAGNPDVTVRRMPGLNHLLQPAQTGAGTEYGSIETTIDPAVLALVTEWVNERFAAPKVPPSPAASMGS